jgi:ABC-type phosphate/phosphonate transport system permease subunit
VVLANYAEVVMLAFLGSFVATILIFSMAFFVREN